MDEDAYRDVYNTVNADRCVFEKALNNRRCECEKKDRKLIATREAVGCLSKAALANCTQFLNTMRQNARFSLKVITIEGPMPHNKELQVQAGGCLQLEKILFPDRENNKHAENIYELVNTGLEQYNDIENFPYSEIVQGIVKYQSRKKRKRS
ncbi:MAG: hypothetical protein V3U84_06080 [Thiotrichaceae bacterium]